MLVDNEYANLVFEAVENDVVLHGHFTWLGSDRRGSWYIPEVAIDSRSNSSILVQAIRASALDSYLVIPQYINWPEFNEYFYALSL
jgi:hypothetical protein